MIWIEKVHFTIKENLHNTLFSYGLYQKTNPGIHIRELYPAGSRSESC